MAGTVRDLKSMLETLAEAYRAGGKKTPLKSVTKVLELLASASESTTVAELAAHIRTSPSPAGSQRGLRTELVAEHLEVLRRAGRDPAAFEAALQMIAADKRVRRDELFAIAAEFAGGKKSYTSMAHAYDALRHRHRQRVTSHEYGEEAAKSRPM